MRTYPRLVVPHRTCPVVFLALAALSACTDGGRPTAPRASSSAAPLVTVQMNCSLERNTAQVRCTSGPVHPTGKVRANGVHSDVVLPPDAVQLMLVFGADAFNGATGVLSIDIAVRNSSDHPIGTADGTTATGVKVFYADGPRVISGSGNVTVVNADSVGAFTAADQKFYDYREIVQPGAESARKRWQWRFTGDVQSWSFDLAVAADIGPARTYTIVDLGTLGGNSAQASAINNRGQVVGGSDDGSGANHPFLWTAERGMADLGTLGGTKAWATALNDSGQVVGESDRADGTHHAFLWTAERGMRDLEPLPGQTWSAAAGINNRGEVVGCSQLRLGGGCHAVLWTAAGEARDLGSLAGSSLSGAVASGIDGSGQVVGQSRTRSGMGHAFLWSAATGMRDLQPTGYYSAAFSINDQGQVAGVTYAGGNIGTAFVWTQATGMRALAGSGTAWAINNVGDVVGDGSSVSGPGHALFWPAAGGVLDLDPQSRYISSARGINDRGEVVGFGVITGQNTSRALLWVP